MKTYQELLAENESLRARAAITPALERVRAELRTEVGEILQARLAANPGQDPAAIVKELVAQSPAIGIATTTPAAKPIEVVERLSPLDHGRNALGEAIARALKGEAS